MALVAQFLFLHSMLVPVCVGALRTLDGGGGCEALRPPGERGGMYRYPGLCALWLFVHGGCSWRAPGAPLWIDLHACGTSAACQQVSKAIWRRRGYN